MCVCACVDAFYYSLFTCFFIYLSIYLFISVCAHTAVRLVHAHFHAHFTQSPSLSSPDTSLPATLDVGSSMPLSNASCSRCRIRRPGTVEPNPPSKPISKIQKGYTYDINIYIITNHAQIHEIPLCMHLGFFERNTRTPSPLPAVLCMICWLFPIDLVRSLHGTGHTGRGRDDPDVFAVS